MKTYKVNGTSLTANSNDLVCFGFSDKFIFSESICKNLKQLREIVLSSEHLPEIQYCRFKNRVYSLSKIYTL